MVKNGASLNKKAVKNGNYYFSWQIRIIIGNHIKTARFYQERL